jgi:DNA topoisomerase-3
MSYPEKYDPALKSWKMDTLPFIPETWKYEVIEGVKKQFKVVSTLLNRKDVDRIYVCTDSGREGEYIYRLVREMAGVKGKDERRVWIDSQTEEEIKRGVREAKPLSEYDHLSESAYLRAKEDYLMGINFSRALTISFGPVLGRALRENRSAVISVGRVMTCVLGMVVRREREIRAFVPTPFYRVEGTLSGGGVSFTGNWQAVKGSRYFESPLLYRENGFKRKEDAEKLIEELGGTNPDPAVLASVTRKTDKKQAPLLYNLAELQNECSKKLKKSPDETLAIVQKLYESKLCTYPRTDARVLSSAVAKEIAQNIRGVGRLDVYRTFADKILSEDVYKKIGSSRYTDDSKITDHYAIIPTGQGLNALGSLKPLQGKVYELIGRRFLSIFLPPAVYRKIALAVNINGESFFANFKTLMEEGWLKCGQPYRNKNAKGGQKDAPQLAEGGDDAQPRDGEEEEQQELGSDMLEVLEKLRKGAQLPVDSFSIRLGETSAPKRYNSGSIILAMENAGQLIEDEDLRAQIKGSGIGTSATRAEILKKLVGIGYLNLNKKTQIITPSLQGELVYEVVNASIKSLLRPDLTASWERGLTYVAEGTISSDEYMTKLEDFVTTRTNGAKEGNWSYALTNNFAQVAKFYNK